MQFELVRIVGGARGMGEHGAIGQEQGWECRPSTVSVAPLTTMSCPSNEVSTSVMSALVVKVAA